MLLLNGIKIPQTTPLAEGIAPGLAGGTAQARMIGMLSPDLLQPSEIIILLLKPSPWFIPLSCLRFLTGATLVLVLLTLGIRRGWVNLGSLNMVPRDVMLAYLGVIGARLFWQFLEWSSRVYVLTDRRVIRLQGVIRVHLFEASLKQIQHTSVYFSLRERLLSLGTIHFATAGTGITEASWQMLARPLEVHRILRQTLERYR